MTSGDRKQQRPEDVPSINLHPDDSDILDLLIEHGFNEDAIGQLPVEKQRRLDVLLEHFRRLDSYPVENPPDELVENLLGRLQVQEQKHQGPATPQKHVALSAEDAEVLDALIESGFDSPASGQEKERADAIVQALDMLQHYPVEDPSDELINATLARIDREQQRQDEAMNIQNRTAPARRRYRMPDMIAVAATIFLAIGIIWPVASMVRSMSLKNQSQQRLRMAHAGIIDYANDHDSLIPMTNDLQQAIGSSWNQYKHSSNLDPLIESNYCELANLTCPGCPQGHRFSYRVPLGLQESVTRLRPDTIILASRSPMAAPMHSESATIFQPVGSTNSRSHGGNGQNVIMIDGAILWMDTPIMGTREGHQDNIWLPPDAGNGTLPDTVGLQKHQRDNFLAN